MIRRIISTVLVLAVLACAAVLPGCGDEIKTHTHTEQKDIIIEQDTVVE